MNPTHEIKLRFDHPQPGMTRVTKTTNTPDSSQTLVRCQPTEQFQEQQIRSLRATVTFEQIESILKGIEQDECESSDGWWENSDGVAFGKKKLAEIKALFYPKS